MPRKGSAREAKKPRETKQPQDLQAGLAPQEIQGTGRILKPEHWIAILNLIILILNSIVFVLFQIQNLQSERANISTTYDNGVVNIINLGPATAQDLRLVFCITSVAPKWATSINDASVLNTSIDNPAVENTGQIRSINCGSGISENNAIQITVKALPPQQSFKLKIAPPSENSFETTNAQLDVYIISSELDGFQINTALEDYLANNIFNIAKIEFSLACQNCNLDKKNISLSSLTKTEISLIDSYYETSNNTKFHYHISSYSLLPQDEELDPIYNLYLKATLNAENQMFMTNIDKFEFNPPNFPGTFHP